MRRWTRRSAIPQAIHVYHRLFAGPGDNPDKVLAMLANTFVLKVWDIGDGTTYPGKSLRNIQGGYALRPRDARIDKYLVTAGMVDAAPMATPAVKGERRKPDEQLADEATSRHIRNMCGQLLYIDQERVGLLWVAKGNAKTMSKPSINDLTRCKRVEIYLQATKGYEATLVPQQDANGLLHVAVDSGWEASHDRRSTSAAVIFYRGAMVSASSRTQGSVSLSSAEAGGYALGSGVCEGLFLRSIPLELNEQVRITCTSELCNTSNWQNSFCYLFFIVTPISIFRSGARLHYELL